MKNEKPKAKAAKKELQALVNGNERSEEEQDLPSALEALRRIKGKFEPTISKPSQEAPKPSKKHANPERLLPEPEEETGLDDEDGETIDPREKEPLPGNEEEASPSSPDLSSKLAERLSENKAAGGPEGESSDEAMEEGEQGEGVVAQPPAMSPSPTPTQLADAISPDVSRQIERYLKQVQLLALEKAEALLRQQATLPLGELIKVTKDLAELQAVLKWQAKLEKQILKGQVPLLPPGGGKFPVLKKIAGLAKATKQAAGGETPSWAGELPE